MSKIKTGKVLAAMIIGIVCTIIISQTSAFANDVKDIRQSVLRLHIIANSDTNNDQELKFAVRDKVLSLESSLFNKAKSIDEVKTTAKNKIDEIRQTAQQEVYLKGYAYEVKAEVCDMYFTTREYDNFTLPAGNYTAVRIIIGKGEGKNWWCVLYPPLCLPAAEDNTKLSDVFTNSEEKIVENSDEYEYGFAAVELIENIKNYFSNN